MMVMRAALVPDSCQPRNTQLAWHGKSLSFTITGESTTAARQQCAVMGGKCFRADVGEKVCVCVSEISLLKLEGIPCVGKQQRVSCAMDVSKMHFFN